jgi:hypothetical protein
MLHLPNTTLTFHAITFSNADMWKIFHTKSVGMFMTYLHIIFH